MILNQCSRAFFDPFINSIHCIKCYIFHLHPSLVSQSHHPAIPFSYPLPPLLLLLRLTLALSLLSRRSRVAYVKVDHVLRVYPLHRDRKRVRGVEREGDQLPGRRRLVHLALQPRVDPKLEQSRVPRKEPDRVLSTRLRPLHHRHQLVVVAEQTKVQIRRTTVALRTDRQLGQNPFRRLCSSSTPGTHDRLLEALLDQSRVNIITRRTRVLAARVHLRNKKNG